MKKIIITGCNGQLGRELNKFCPHCGKHFPDQTIQPMHPEDLILNEFTHICPFITLIFIYLNNTHHIHECQSDYPSTS